MYIVARPENPHANIVVSLPVCQIYNSYKSYVYQLFACDASKNLSAIRCKQSYIKG